MEPGDGSNDPSCGNYTNPCQGIEESVAQAQKESASTIVAFPGVYVPNSPITIDFSLNMTSQNPSNTTIRQPSSIGPGESLFTITGHSNSTISFGIYGFTLDTGPPTFPHSSAKSLPSYFTFSYTDVTFSEIVFTGSLAESNFVAYNQITEFSGLVVFENCIFMRTRGLFVFDGLDSVIFRSSIVKTSEGNQNESFINVGARTFEIENFIITGTAKADIFEISTALISISDCDISDITIDDYTIFNLKADSILIRNISMENNIEAASFVTYSGDLEMRDCSFKNVSLKSGDNSFIQGDLSKNTVLENVSFVNFTTGNAKEGIFELAGENLTLTGVTFSTINVNSLLNYRQIENGSVSLGLEQVNFINCTTEESIILSIVNGILTMNEVNIDNCVAIEEGSSLIDITGVLSAEVFISNSNFTTVLSDITISDSTASITNCSFYDIGGSIYSYGGTNLTISNCVFYDCNFAKNFEFGEYVALLVVESSSLQITGCLFDGINYPYGIVFSVASQILADSVVVNQSSGGFGCEGGDAIITDSRFSNISNTILSSVYLSNVGSSTLSNVTFENTSGNAGSAVFLTGTTSFALRNVYFQGGYAHEGGCMYVASNATGTIEDSEFNSCISQSLGGAFVLSGGSNTTFLFCMVGRSSAMSGGGFVMQETATALFKYSIIHHNSANASAGGILLADYSKLETEYCVVYNNSANSAGGGIYIANFASFTDTVSSISDNFSPSQGGGIFLKDSSSIYITNATINNNQSNSTGGGISLSGASKGTLTLCNITNNGGSKGGGVAVHNTAHPTFISCIISGNNATTAGGVLVTDLAMPNFSTCTFEDNHSKTSAGCILATDQSKGFFESCHVSGNTAPSGTGGGFLLEDFTETTINNTLISNNRAYSGGGLMVTSIHTLHINNCTFEYNSARLNGGAMTFDENARAVVVGGVCRNNSAFGRGGCVSVQGVSKPIVTMNMCNNVAVIAGGGIYASSNTNITIVNSEITCNAAAIGGGLFLENTVTGIIVKSQIFGNSGTVGGGAFVQGSAVAFYDIQVQNNTATQNGGGFAVEGTSLRFYMNNSLFEGNRAEENGGGLYLSDNSMLFDQLPINLPDSIHNFNAENITISGNSAAYGGGVYVTTKNPPSFGSFVSINQNNAEYMGGGIFIAGAQQSTEWMARADFSYNLATWGGCNVGWNYMSNMSIANTFCRNCDFNVPLQTSGFQTTKGFATLPFQMNVTNCPTYITLDNGPIQIKVQLLDQFDTWITGDILRNSFRIQLSQRQEGCIMDPPMLDVEVDPNTGYAEFSGLSFSGKQNSTCKLQFVETTQSPNLTTSIQNTNYTMILYGCNQGYGVHYVNSTIDTCLPSTYNKIETLVLTTVFFFFMLICILITFIGSYMRKKRQKQKENEQQGLLVFDEDSIITIADIKKDPGIPNIKWNEVTLTNRIGRGASGLVWSAKWNRGNGTENIAVKELLVGVDKMEQSNLREFLCEIKIMSSLFHKKIVRFIGISVPAPQKIYLITELMQRGSLRELLDSVPDFTWDLRLKFAIDAAKGVEYLHGRGLIHRDLKTSNLLINEDCVCKVADFGISTVKSGTSQDERCVGTPVYMAPEVLQNNIYSKQADVYAWGIILYELYTKQYPYSEAEYANMHVANLTYQIAFKGIRPDCSRIQSVVRQLIVDCWNENPDLRPTFSEIIGRLKRIKKMKLQVTNDDDVNVSMRDLVSIDRNNSQLPKLMTNSDGSDRTMYDSVGINTDSTDLIIQPE